MPPVIDFLQYGAIGLGLALAVLAYLLLQKEQAVAKPRREIVKAIYVFMGFSLVLASAGFGAEYARSDAASVGKLRAELEERARNLSTVEEKYRQTAQELSSSRSLIYQLMTLKGGKIERLKQLNSKAPEYVALVAEIQKDLEAIDRAINHALGR